MEKLTDGTIPCARKVAVLEAINYLNIKCLEDKHRKGYEAFPMKADEFSIFEKEQVWGIEAK